MVVVGRVGHPLTAAADVTLGDVFAFPLVGPGMDADAAELLDALAAAAADLAVAAGRRRAADHRVRQLRRPQADPRRVRRLDVHAPLRRRRDLRAGPLAVVADVDLGLRVRFGAAWLRGRTLGGAGTTFLDLLQTIGPARSRPAD